MDVWAGTPHVVSQMLAMEEGLANGYVYALGDISAAFLHALIPQEIVVLVRPPPSELAEPDDIWHLFKALYGLRPSPQWFQQHEARELKEADWQRTDADAMLFVHRKLKAYLCIHADDLLLVCSESDLEPLKAAISKRFRTRWEDVIDGDHWSTYLGRQWRRSACGLQMRVNPAYYDSVLQTLGMSKCKPVVGLGITANELREDVTPQLGEVEAKRFKSAVGKLMWLCAARPDLSYITKELARTLTKPTELRMKILKRVARYLQGTRRAILVFAVDVEQPLDTVVVYADASWASDAGRRSTSGGLLVYRGFVFSFWSRTQTSIAQSTCESELVACNTAVCEGKLLVSLLASLGREAKIRVYCDNTAAIQFSARVGVGRMKHLELRELFLQDQVRQKLISLQHIGGFANPADLLTKVLSRPRTEELCRMIGLSLDRPEGGEPEGPACLVIDVGMMDGKFNESSVEADDDEEQTSHANGIVFFAGIWQLLSWAWKTWSFLRGVAVWVLRRISRLALHVLDREGVQQQQQPPEQPQQQQRPPEPQHQTSETRAPALALTPFRAGGRTPFRCHCGLVCYTKMVQRTSSAHYMRVYVSCEKAHWDRTRCDFFQWL